MRHALTPGAEKDRKYIMSDTITKAWALGFDDVWSRNMSSTRQKHLRVNNSITIPNYQLHAIPRSTVWCATLSHLGPRERSDRNGLQLHAVVATTH
jgi:hypothetical protein